MTTKLGMDNDLVLAPESEGENRYKQRRQVHHLDGPNPSFWSQSYFIPGISGKARCLQDLKDTTATGSMEKLSPKRQTSTSNESTTTAHTTNTTRSSLERSWCAPKALRRVETKKQSKDDDEVSHPKREESSSSDGTNSSSKEKEACSSLPNHPWRKENAENSFLPDEDALCRRSISMDETSLQDNVEQDLQKLFQEFRAQRQESEGSE